MHQLYALLLAGIFLCPSLSYAQNDQGKVVYAFMEELSAAFGEESLELMKRIKSESDYAVYLRKKAKGCHNCPVLNEFVKGLSAPPRQPMGIPPRGANPNDLPPRQAAISKNFGLRIYIYYETNIYGVDNETEDDNKCGPLFGLSRWGCPLPCHGFCPRDPLEVPGNEEEEEDPDYSDGDGEGDDYDYDYDYDDDNSGEEPAFDFDYYEGDNDGDYEYDPN